MVNTQRIRPPYDSCRKLVVELSDTGTAFVGNGDRWLNTRFVTIIESKFTVVAAPSNPLLSIVAILPSPPPERVENVVL